MWLLIPILVYFIVYFIVRHIYSHWKRNGYPTERANLNWQFLKKIYKREFDHVEAVNEAYKTGGRLPFLGIYFLFQPMLLIRDIPLAQTILEHTHNCFINSEWEYLHGYRRINMLEKLAPIFAANRVEGMFRNIDKISEYMVNHLNAIMQTTNESPLYIDMQHVIKISSANIIGNLIYGVDINMYKQTDSIFTVYKDTQLPRFIFSYTLSHFPKKSVLTYKLRDLLRASIQRRETEGYIRKDILQLLVKYRNGNEIGTGSKSNWHIENNFVQERLISIERLSKVAEKLMHTNYETISSTAVMTLVEVLQQPNVLHKLLDEINSAKFDIQSNKSSAFEILSSLKYLDACIQETLRLHPSVPIIERICSKHFNIPHSRFVVSVGSKVAIPVMALQRDERYFPEPHKYKPERFVNIEKPLENSMKYILAKTSSVSLALSKVVVKIILMKLFNNFSLEMVPNKIFKICHNPAPYVKSRDGFSIPLRSKDANQCL